MKNNIDDFDQIFGWIDDKGAFHEVSIMGHYDYADRIFGGQTDDDPMLEALHQGWVQVRLVAGEVSVFLFGTTPLTQKALSRYLHESRRNQMVDRFVINDRVFDDLSTASAHLSELPPTVMARAA